MVRRTTVMAALVAALTPAMPASATVPGQNGKIAYTQATCAIACARDIHSVNASGGNDVNLTASPADDVDPAWSPDGAKLAWTSRSGGVSGPATIWTMNANGSGKAQLTASSSSDADVDPAW